MWKCIRCEKENQDFIENCMECGHGKTMNYIEYKTVSKVQNSVQSNWKQEQNTPEYFKKKEKPVLMACADGNFVLGTNIPKEEICEIEFVKINETTMSDDAWDVSAEKNKTIWAWTENTENGKILKIGSENGVYANPDCQSFFEGYSNVVKIEFHDLFDTSQVTDMGCMFAGCEEIKQLDVSRFDTSQVTDMGCMFMGCELLSELDISVFDTRHVTSMTYMFLNCKCLEKLDVSGFDTRCAESMRGMFYKCQKVKELDVSGFDTSQVTDMMTMFAYCYKLNYLDISNFDTWKVTEFFGMFRECKEIETLDVSKFDTGRATNMRDMFSGCKKLERLDVSNFDTEQVTDMSYMFSGCENLVDLDISNFYFRKDVKFEDMFKDSAMAEVYDEKAIQELYRKDNPEKSVPEKASSIKSVSIDEKILDELDELWLKKSEALLHQKRFIVHNHNQLDKRKNKRIYEANSIEGIVRKFLEYKENRPVNNGQKKKKLINALQIGADDKIYLLHDYSRSIFSSGKYGFALTDKGIYLASPWKMSKFISWKIFQEASAIDTECLGFDVTIDRGETITYNGLDKEIALQLEMMFIAIYKLLNAEKDIFIEW